MKITYLAYWMGLNSLLCVKGVKNLQNRYFSCGENITLNCNSKVSFWSGPASNTLEPNNESNNVEILDEYGELRQWNISIYTKGQTVKDTLPQNLFKRLDLIGDNFDLLITNMSTSDEGLYICDINNSTVLQNRFLLQNKYKPSMKINVTGSFVVEEESTQLCCISKSKPEPTSISWFKEDKELVSTTNGSSLCYKLINVSRNDTGNYTCSSENIIGNSSQKLLVVILYPPVVNVLIQNLTEDRKTREIQCMAQGEPDNVTYFRWEHRSVFNEHIRYLDATSDGILQLLEHNESHRYQNTGIYVCNVSNGIHDYNGNVFQQGKVYLELEGPPVFATNNKNIQYNNMESSVEIIVNVYSSSEIKCHNITAIGSLSVPPRDVYVNKRPILLKENFYNAIITLNGTEIIFVLYGLNSHGYRKFNVTMCNSYGQSSFVVDVLREAIHQTTQPTVVIVTAVILTLIIVPFLLKCICYVKHSVKNETVAEDTEVIEGQSESIENRLYHSVQEREMGVSQTHQDDLMDDVSLTVSNARLNNQATESQLNYADVIFQPSSSINDVQIIGLEDRIHYADVEVSVRTAFLRDTDSVGDESDLGNERSSSEDDFVYVDRLTNYTQNRTTNL